MHRSAVRAAALPALVLALALPASPVRADDVSDAIAAAGKAYASGNLKSAANSLSQAMTGIRTRQQALLKALLPPAPPGFTMTINSEFSQGFALTGGGTEIEAEYQSGNDSFRLDITADNPMIATMAPMLTDPQMMSSAGKVVSIGKQLVLELDQSLATLVGNRILVQLQDGNVPVMLPVMREIDFAALATFDQK